MLSRRNILIGIGAALGVAVIVLGAIGVAKLVLDRDDDDDKWKRTGKLSAASPATVDRAAGILGVEPEAMRAAIIEARREQANEAYRARLDRMVEEGQLTQEEADSQYVWFQNRPDEDLGRQGWGRGGDGHSRDGKFRRGGRERHDGPGFLRGKRGDRDGEGSHEDGDSEGQ